MLALVQRSLEASVSVDSQLKGSISRGLLVFLGVGSSDNQQEALYLSQKLVNLRIFNDADGKMNLSLKDTCGQALIISQFTLHADTKKGNRPSFTDAMAPVEAEKLYQYFCSCVSDQGIFVQQGVFGAHMKVELINDGPVTIMLKSRNEYCSSDKQ